MTALRHCYYDAFYRFPSGQRDSNARLLLSLSSTPLPPPHTLFPCPSPFTYYQMHARSTVPMNTQFEHTHRSPRYQMAVALPCSALLCSHGPSSFNDLTVCDPCMYSSHLRWDACSYMRRKPVFGLLRSFKALLTSCAAIHPLHDTMYTVKTNTRRDIKIKYHKMFGTDGGNTMVSVCLCLNLKSLSSSRV